MTQAELFTVRRSMHGIVHFDGPDLTVADVLRLSGQMAGVYNLMKDGVWRTPAEIAAQVEGSESGLTARLRDLRKAKWGGHDVTKRRRGSIWEYRLVVKP